MSALENILGPIGQVLAPLKDVLILLQKNAWTIVFVLLGGYWFKSNYIDPRVADYRRDASYREATKPDRVALLEADMRKVRAAQQEETQRRAKEAAEAAEAKKRDELKKKKVEQPGDKQGQRLGTKKDKKNSTSTTSSGGGSGDGSNPWASGGGGGGGSSSRGGGGGYNAMNPSSGHVAGYRAARRNPARS